MTATKYTRRQYDADVNANQAAIASIDVAIEALHDEFNADPAAGIANGIGERFNALYDRRYELELERQAIESRWVRRNWTASDYSSWDLVTANAD